MEKELDLGKLLAQEAQLDEPVSLWGENALLLWLKGKDAWNQWMEENPGAEVSFAHVIFDNQKLKKHFPDYFNTQEETLFDEVEEFCFEGFIFGGDTDFSKATFNGIASFNNSTFKGDVNFSNSIFNTYAFFQESSFSGEVDFIESTFSDDAYFDNSTFSDHTRFKKVIFSGGADFKNVTFSGYTVFSGATFSGDANFKRAGFSGLADFVSVNFNNGVDFTKANFIFDISFGGTQFNGLLDFLGANFLGEALFRDVTFSNSANFSNTAFCSTADFNNANFGGYADFLEAIFSDHVEFNNAVFESTFKFKPNSSEEVVSLDFRGAAFNKLFLISGNYTCIPDLRQTKTSHHLDLSELKVQLKRTAEGVGAIGERAIDPLDSERLCRLKEIAESNKDQIRALAFHADEQRASRWIALNPWQSILDSFYSLTSNYGQSIFRPFVFLMMSIFVFSHVTISYADSKKDVQLTTAIVISVATVTPFMAISKDARSNNIKKIFSNDIPESYVMYGYFHSFCSFIFIFLIGLGLRNRFRI
ncbi:hypothetical protein JF50_07830 [Pseudoalteromonas luteoviolacea]|uniref:Pentapeptide repeat-containing protein n=1 Tax=Pseudoalteromonas luteoviolacea TaxID=43657 RepID=A0A0C1QQ10_9GAMM|nr:pentapeptide repeat-containing protein [Pseudoalteromonas luteoviolacea]KID57142.1 hypothetical protein JF50_07830 [Pseudoalteromonas luteoviolacea]